MAKVLITGATGSFGGAVARALAAGGHTLDCVVRGRPGEPAALRARDHALPGALVELDLGGSLAPLAPRRWDVVVHAAADTSFFARDPRAQRRMNLEVAASLLRATAPATFVFLSTAEVAGTRGGVVLEAEADVGQQFVSALQESKLAAELTLRREATTHGVDLRIVRPAVIVGDPGGRAAADGFTSFARFLAEVAWQPRYARSQLRVPGIKPARLNLAPRAWAAAAVTALAMTPSAAGGTFHLAAHDVSQDQLFSALAERLSFPGLRVSRPRGSTLRAPTRLEFQAHALLARHYDELLLDRQLDDREARRVLEPIGLGPPSLAGRDLARFVDALVG